MTFADTRTRWLALYVLCLASLMIVLDVTIVGVALPSIKDDLGFSDNVFGFGAGIFFLGYFLFGVPSNLMVEKLGARRWISLIIP